MENTSRITWWYSSHWVDEELETGICSSYAIIPTDRTGNPNYLAAKVSMNEGSWIDLEMQSILIPRFQDLAHLLYTTTTPIVLRCI